MGIKIINLKKKLYNTIGIVGYNNMVGEIFFAWGSHHNFVTIR